MKREKVDKTGKYEAIKTFILSLDIKGLPNSSKVNLLCSLILLIALVFVVAEPILAYIDSIVVSICNTCISIFSDGILLPTRNIDNGVTASWCIIAFVIELILCPTVVFVLDGFKHAMKGKTN